MVDHINVNGKANPVFSWKMPSKPEVDYSVRLAEQHESFFIHTNEAHYLLIKQHHIINSQRLPKSIKLPILRRNFVGALKP